MRKKRVVLAMSGGVDSSVCAVLLQSKGFEVVGVTMQIAEGRAGAGSCCGLEAAEDAGRVAYKLGIPHYVLNFRNIFKEKVIADFCQEYKQGRTPNPCIRCNQYIKFEHLLKKARQLNADYIATGHYARIDFDKKKKRYLLKKGIDPHKDQSYVLYTMSQDQLRHTLMPLGKLTKSKVRAIARKKGLPVAERPESQEICFVPGNDYGAFLKKQIPRIASPGPIVNREGEVIGEHQGIIFYTVGQRKGMGIAARQPLYVISIDKKSNTVVAGKKEDAYSKELIADSLSFISKKKPKMPFRAKVKIRYLHPAASAKILPEGKDRVRVKFDQPQWAVTPGQAAVFYQGHTVLGGATIKGTWPL